MLESGSSIFTSGALVPQNSIFKSFCSDYLLANIWMFKIGNLLSLSCFLSPSLFLFSLEASCCRSRPIRKDLLRYPRYDRRQIVEGREALIFFSALLRAVNMYTRINNSRTFAHRHTNTDPSSNKRSRGALIETNSRWLTDWLTASDSTRCRRFATNETFVGEESASSRTGSTSKIQSYGSSTHADQVVDMCVPHAHNQMATCDMTKYRWMGLR